jgi:hypothetical protein
VDEAVSMKTNDMEMSGQNAIASVETKPSDDTSTREMIGKMLPYGLETMTEPISNSMPYKQNLQNSMRPISKANSSSQGRSIILVAQRSSAAWNACIF